MTNGALSLAQTPPLFVPLRYMLTAPLFAMIAAVLVLLYPESVTNRWSPVMLAVTHLLVLGFAAMVMFGAVQQLIPVLAGVSLGHPNLVSISLHAGLVLGVSCLSAGLFLSNATLTFLALVFLSATIVAFITTMILALLRSDANPHSIRGIRLALLSFLVSVAVGLYLTAGHSSPDLILARNLTSLHFTWGLLGWIGLLVIAVSYQVVPMFQLTPKYPTAIVSWLAPFIFVSLILWSLVEFYWYGSLTNTWTDQLPQVAIALGLLAFCLVTLWLQQKRRRKLPDVTLDYFRVALISMIIAIGAWALPAPWLADHVNREVLIGVLLIVGFTMSVISGMLYKIVPFLIWLHLTNEIDMSERWQRNIPNMKQIIAEAHTRWQFRLHLASLLALIVAMGTPTWVVQLGAVLLLASNIYLLRNLVVAVMVYRAQLAPVEG